MTEIPVAGQDRPCGLRERKKARTRADDQSIIAVFERIDQALALLEAGLPL